MGQSDGPATALWGHFVSVGILDRCLVRSVVWRADMCQIPSSRAPRITHYTSHRCLPREVTPTRDGKRLWLDEISDVAHWTPAI